MTSPSPERTLQDQLMSARLVASALRDQNLWQRRLLDQVARDQPGLLKRLATEMMLPPDPGGLTKLPPPPSART